MLSLFFGCRMVKQEVMFFYSNTVHKPTLPYCATLLMLKHELKFNFYYFPAHLSAAVSLTHGSTITVSKLYTVLTDLQPFTAGWSFFKITLLAFSHLLSTATRERDKQAQGGRTAEQRGWSSSERCGHIKIWQREFNYCCTGHIFKWIFFFFTA